MSHTPHNEKHFTFYVTPKDDKYDNAPTLTMLNKVHREISATIVTVKNNAHLFEIIFFENGKRISNTPEIYSFKEAFQCLRGKGHFNVSNVFTNDNHFEDKLSTGEETLCMTRLFDFLRLAVRYRD